MPAAMATTQQRDDDTSSLSSSWDCCGRAPSFPPTLLRGLKPFRGHPGEDPDSHVDDFEEDMLSGGVGDLRRWPAAFLCSLRAEPLVWVRRHLDELEQLQVEASWDAVRQAFLERYRPADHPSRRVDHLLLELQQGAEEPAAAYVWRARRLLQEVRPWPQAVEAAAKACFVSGLRDECYNPAMEMDWVDLEACYRLAERAEAVSQVRRGRASAAAGGRAGDGAGGVVVQVEAAPTAAPAPVKEPFGVTMRALWSEVADLEEAAGTQKEELARVKDAVTASELVVNREWPALRDEVAALSAQVAALREQVVAQEIKLAVQEKQLDVLEKQLELQGKQLEEQKEQMAAQERQLAEQELAAQVLRLALQEDQSAAKEKEQSAAKEKQLAELEKQLAKFEQQLAGHEQQLAGHEKQLAVHRKQVVARGEQMMNQEQVLTAHKQQLGEHAERMAGQDEQLTVHKGQLAKQKTVLEELEDEWVWRVAELERQVAAVKSNVAAAVGGGWSPSNPAAAGVGGWPGDIASTSVATSVADNRAQVSRNPFSNEEQQKVPLVPGVRRTPYPWGVPPSPVRKPGQHTSSAFNNRYG